MYRYLYFIEFSTKRNKTSVLLVNNINLKKRNFSYNPNFFARIKQLNWRKTCLKNGRKGNARSITIIDYEN